MTFNDLKALPSVGKTLDKITPAGMLVMQRQDIRLEEKWYLLSEPDKDALLEAFERASVGIQLIQDVIEAVHTPKKETNENS